MRRAVLQIHLWTALVAGALIVVLGLSGSALVFRPDIERWLAREWLTVAPAGNRLPLDELVTRAIEQDPAKRLSRVVLPASAESSVEVILTRPRARNLKDARLVSVYLDPYRGTVLGTRARGEGVLWALQDLHYALFAGEPGLKVNGVAAAALLVLALTGPLLWWPARGRWRNALRVRWEPMVARWRDLHAVTGIVLFLVLALISATALYYAYRSTATALITATTGGAGTPPPKVEPASGVALASIDALVAAARAAVPEARLDELRPARGPGLAASVSFRLPGDVVTGRHRVYLDPATAAIVRIDLHESQPAGARLAENMAPWHYGSFAGRVSQWIWFVAGLTPAMFFGSGLWLWLRRRRRRVTA
jgi:uncharacterized iron-regulated membrane protein